MTVAFAVPDVLVARAQAGDQEALEALYRAFETPVYNLVRRMLRRPEDAEDVVQEWPRSGPRDRGARRRAGEAGDPRRREHRSRARVRAAVADVARGRVAA